MGESSESGKQGFFDRPFVFLIAVSLAAGLACYLVMGEVVFGQVLYSEGRLLIDVIPRIAAATLLAGFLQAMVSRDMVTKWIGTESGWRGLFIGTVAGVVMPGGPITTFPLVVAFYGAGADMGALVAYLTAWSALAFNRVLIWELPFMGPEFAAIRVLSALPLPIIAGLIARALVERYGTGLGSAAPPAPKDTAPSRREGGGGA